MPREPASLSAGSGASVQQSPEPTGPRGLMSRLRAWREERQQAAAQEAYTEALADWQSELNDLKELLEVAWQYRGGSQADIAQTGVLLETDETPYMVLKGAMLIEVRRDRGHYEGGTQGFSVRLSKGVTYRVAGHKGAYVPGEEEPFKIDEGMVVITNRRVIFQGPSQTREWDFDKLIGMQHDDERPWTAIHVRNRQKVSGVGYGDRLTPHVRLRLDLAVADYQGRPEIVAERLRHQVEQHIAAKPALGT